jgi:hypothetical protein
MSREFRSSLLLHYFGATLPPLPVVWHSIVAPGLSMG